MDCRTGEIVNMDEVVKKLFEEQRNFKEIKTSLSPQQVRRGKVCLEDPCPCTSGKTFGECCYSGIKLASEKAKEKK